MKRNEIYNTLFEGNTVRFSNSLTKCKVEMYYRDGEETFYATFNPGEHLEQYRAKFSDFESLMNVLEVNQYIYLGI